MVVRVIEFLRHGDRPRDMRAAPLSEIEELSGFEKATGNCALTANGHVQAQQLANHLAARRSEERPQMLFSSPYWRAMQTLLPSSRKLGLILHCEPGFQEEQHCDGIHPDLSTDQALNVLASLLQQDLDADYMRDQNRIFQYAHADDKIQPGKIRLNCAELNKADTLDRALLVIRPFIQQVERLYPHAERILIASHGTPIIAFARALSGDQMLYSPDTGMSVYTGHICRLVRKHHEGIFGKFDLDKSLSDQHLSPDVNRLFGWQMEPSDVYYRQREERAGRTLANGHAKI